jgi:hypothetical protein
MHHLHVKLRKSGRSIGLIYPTKIGREQSVRRLGAVRWRHLRHVGGGEGSAGVALGDQRVDPAERRGRGTTR